MQNQIDQKIVGFSLLRVVASFLVILIHVSGPEVVKYGKISNFSWQLANFYDSMARVAVPVFFMISGALLLSKEIILKEFLKKRLYKIILPFVFWSIFYSVFNRLFINNESFDLYKLIRDVFYGSEYHLWFVYYLIGLYLITPIIEKWVRTAKNIDFYYFFIIWIFTIIIAIPKIGIYFPKVELRYFSGFLGYFIMGYYLKNCFKISRLFSLFLFVFGSLVTIFGTAYFSNKHNIFLDYFYNYDSLGVLISALGLFSLVLQVNFKTYKLNKMIAFLSDFSFGIFLVHPLVLTLLRKLELDLLIGQHVDFILIITSFTFFSSFAIAFLFKKIVILNKLV